MPLIPAMTLALSYVDAPEIYTAGLFHPASPADSLEILNGGLTVANYAGGAGSIKPWMLQTGQWAEGGSIAFDDWQFAYAKVMRGDSTSGTNPTMRVVVPGLATSFVAAWPASCILIGYEGWFRQDATFWLGKVHMEERWDGRVYLDTVERSDLYVWLPHGRSSTGGPDPTIAPVIGHDGDEPGVHNEARWRWVTKLCLVTAGSFLLAGPHNAFLSLHPRVYQPDHETAKCIVPTGRIWMVRFR
ncbi:MAG: hypothetical protein WC869_08110 [Phycisphaerae bacterium]|jgi:hypothetical protein